MFSSAISNIVYIYSMLVSAWDRLDLFMQYYLAISYAYLFDKDILLDFLIISYCFCFTYLATY
jgi:hypothetical protein